MFHSPQRIIKFASLLLVCLLVTLSSFAQDPRGTVLGRVVDATGAVVPNAEVRIVNDATGVAASAKTNDAGNFTLPYLLTGTYTLSCEQSGFKKWIRPGIQVRIQDTVEVDIDLAIGSTSETMEVKETTPLLSTAEASLGQVIDERRVLELPQFAGNAMDLVHLAPGTVNGTNMRLRKAGFNNAPSTFSTDGGGNYQNEFTIDGVPNVYSDGTQPRVAFSPPQTAIGEFKVQTSAFDASLGHTMGSTVNISTKGGTNILHGEAHEWFRHSALDAPTIFQNRSGQKISIYQDNRYGASAGAPVIIPKLYDGKNRTFWFFAYEANKFGNPDSGGNITSSVPTAKMHNGDLSDYLALGSAYQIYDPRSTKLVNGTYTRTAIPGNIIPKSMIDPVATKIINLYPLPNQAGTKDFQNNYYRSGKALEDYWAYIGRIDHAFSENHRAFLRFHRDYWEEDKNRNFDNDINGVILNRNNKGVSFDDVIIFGPTFLMNFRYGLTYQDFPERRASQGYDLASLGLSSNLIGMLPNRTIAPIPQTAITSFSTLSAWESQDGVTASNINAFIANFTKMKGNHNIRFGPEFRVYRESRNRYGQALSPQYAFSAEFTKASNTSANPTRGGELAAMMMGIPAGSMSITDSYVEQDKYFGIYIHDDWKVSKKLTVNIGLRYDYESPITERFDRAAIHFAGTTANPLNDAARANYAKNPIPELAVSAFSAMGGLTYANVSPNGRAYWQAEKTNFQPRFGLAYQVDPKTIVRAGYGIFTASVGVSYTNTNQTGFSQSTPIQASLDNGLTYRATIADPFPTGLIQPVRSSSGLSTNLGQGVSFFGDKRPHPYSQRWSVGMQRQLPFQAMIEASYVGNRNTRFGVNRELSYTPAQYLSTSPVRDQATIDYLGKTFPNPYAGLNPIYGSVISRGSLLRNYSEFSSVQYQLDPIGYSWYHSLQTRVERRLANSWTLQASYTWSKAMEAAEFMNAADAMPYESLASLDRTHRLTGSGIWELPFGHKRHWGANWHRSLDFIAGGWQLGGIYQHQSGAPLGFGNRIFNGDLKNIVRSKDTRSVDSWFIPAATAGFETSGSKQLASNLRALSLRFSSVRGPNQDRWDFSLIKNFRITERWVTQFRAETFNAMNHPNLYDPNTDPTSASWGTINGQDTPRSWQMSLKLTW
jgi:hypothetical protein